MLNVAVLTQQCAPKVPLFPCDARVCRPLYDLSMRGHRDSQTAQNSSRETYHTATTGKDETFAWFVWLKHVHCRLETRISGAARIALQP